MNPEDLGEVGECGIQMVTSLDKVLALFKIVAVVTLFPPAGAGLLPERQLQQDELFQEPRRRPDLPPPFLAGNGKCSIRRPGGAAEGTEIENRRRPPLENHRLRVIPDPVRTAPGKRPAQCRNLFAAGLVGETDPPGGQLGGTAESGVVQVLIGGQRERLRFHERGMKHLAVDRRVEFALETAHDASEIQDCLQNFDL